MRKLRNIRSLGGPRSVATVPWEKRRLAASSARWALGGPRCCAADHFAAGFASGFFAAGKRMSILRTCRKAWQDVNGGYPSPEALYDYCHSHRAEF